MGESRKLGVWLVGALGDIATATVAGAAAIARGLSSTRGMVTELSQLGGLDLARLDGMVFGGHDIRDGSPVDNARLLAREGLFPETLVPAIEPDLAAHGRRVRAGITFGCGSVVARLEHAASRSRRALGPRGALAAIETDLTRFREDEGVDRVVLVHLTSTEPVPPSLPELESEDGVRSLIARGEERLPASVLYATAALDLGIPYINFTPCLGAAAPGLMAAFEQRRVCHAGRDGKTGETLVRSALAPMFLARNLGVLSWAGYNILGNRDGQVLEEPSANAAKREGKENVLSSILSDSLGTTTTRIDYVPSIGDWKTAWDHVHFEGFLGMRGTLQFTWRASDTMLAAPLVLDLVRLVDLASRRGRSGIQKGLACFFKNPTGVSEQSLARQFDFLLEMCAGLAHP